MDEIAPEPLRLAGARRKTKYPITKGEVVQCLLAAVWAWVAFYVGPGAPGAHTPPIFVLIVGFVGSYLTTFLFVWVRWGWRAARSMSLG